MNAKNNGAKLLKASASPVAGSSVADAALARQRADVDKILQDIQLVANRISETRGEAITFSNAPSFESMTDRTNSISPFVTGLRSIATESERRGAEKLVHLSTLLDRISEYDRIILSKTAPPETSATGTPLRRKSLGADLHSLPSHLRIVDRLLDLYHQSKRITVIRTTVEENNSKVTDSEAIKADKTLIDSLKSSLAKANVRCDEADKKRIAGELECAKYQQQVIALRKELQDAKDSKELEQNERGKLQEEMQGEKQQRTEEINLLQQRLENEMGMAQSVLRTLMSKAARVAEGKIQGSNGQEYNQLVRQPNTHQYAFLILVCIYKE
jgi:hypothetical protein